MPILITGHRGFIGQNMMAALPNAVGYEWGDGPLSLEGIDRVIHLGAISSTACNDLYRLQTQNVDFTLDLLARCAAREIPLQFASSASVYGPKAKTFREADPVAPCNLYAQTKHAIEEYILSRDWPMPVQAFRYFNVYGPHEDHKDQPSPYSLFRRQAADTGKIVVFAGSESICRDFVPVERVVEVHKRFFDLPVSGVYNIGTGKAVSFMDVARTVALETDAEIVTVPMPYIPSYQRFTQADMAKTHSLL